MTKNHATPMGMVALFATIMMQLVYKMQAISLFHGSSRHNLRASSLVANASAGSSAKANAVPAVLHAVVAKDVRHQHVFEHTDGSEAGKKSFVHFLSDKAFEETVDEFTPFCYAHVVKLIEKVDWSYTDVQLGSLLLNDCVDDHFFPYSRLPEFYSFYSCQRFAQKLVDARDLAKGFGDFECTRSHWRGWTKTMEKNMSQSGRLAKSCQGYVDFCQDFWHYVKFPPKDELLGKKECPCVGLGNMTGSHVIEMDKGDAYYPADHGSRCEAWEDGRIAECKEGGKPGKGNSWCAQRWCYVDPCNCNIPILPKLSQVGMQYQDKPAYWSYATCGGTDLYTKDNFAESCTIQQSERACLASGKCYWDGARCGGEEIMNQCEKPKDNPIYGTKGCRCLGLHNRNGSVDLFITNINKIAYPVDVGSTCKAWEEDLHPSCQGPDGTKPPWCTQPWCWVDPCSCDFKVPPKKGLNMVTYKDRHAFYSYETCGGVDEWTDIVVFHEYCISQKSVENCTSLDHCAWTGSKCLEKNLIDQCPKDHFKNKLPPKLYGNDKCRCVGLENITGTYLNVLDGTKIKYDADTGAKCSDWDMDFRPECKFDPAPEWCHEKWCYVDPCECDLPVLPKLTKAQVEYKGKPAYWSYATCGSADTYTYDNYPDACVMQKTEEKCIAMQRCAWHPTKKICGGRDIITTCAKENKVDVEVYGKQDCACVGLAHRNGTADLWIDPKNKLTYHIDVGATCKEWELNRHVECQGSDVPSWCTQAWCFVDPCTCNSKVPPKITQSGVLFRGKPAYWSYDTCGSVDKWSQKEDPMAYCVTQKFELACNKLTYCTWNGKKCLGTEIVEHCGQKVEAPKKPKPRDPDKYGNQKCRCVGLDELDGTVAFNYNGSVWRYPADAGASCKDWDNGVMDQCKDGAFPGFDNGWCATKWCYVDPCKCEIDDLPVMSELGARYQGKPAYFSFATCGKPDEYTEVHRRESCVMQTSEEACTANDKCAWDGIKCGGKDLMLQCSRKVEEKVFGLEGCKCIGIHNRTGDVKLWMSTDEKLKYHADVGATCKAWEQNRHPDCIGSNVPKWCNEAWCYVDPCSCNTAVPPRLNTNDLLFQGRAAYWSYETCGSADEWQLEPMDTYCANHKSKDGCRALGHCKWVAHDERCLSSKLVEECGWDAVEPPKE